MQLDRKGLWGRWNKLAPAEWSQQITLTLMSTLVSPGRTWPAWHLNHLWRYPKIPSKYEVGKNGAVCSPTLPPANFFLPRNEATVPLQKNLCLSCASPLFFLHD